MTTYTAGTIHHFTAGAAGKYHIAAAGAQGGSGGMGRGGLGIGADAIADNRPGRRLAPSAPALERFARSGFQPAHSRGI